MSPKTEPVSELRRWRDSEGLTLAEVSGITGVSVPMLSLVEHGKRRLAWRTKIIVARKLRVAVDVLFPPEPVDVEELAEVASS